MIEHRIEPEETRPRPRRAHGINTWAIAAKNLEQHFTAEIGKPLEIEHRRQGEWAVHFDHEVITLITFAAVRDYVRMLKLKHQKRGPKGW